MPRNRKYLKRYTPFKCQPFAARPVLVNGTPIGTPQLQPQLQPRDNLGSEETAVGHQQVRVEQARSDGYLPHHAVVDVHEAGNHVGDSQALPPVTTTQVTTTPVVGGPVSHQHHAASSPRRDQVSRSRSPGLERRGSLEPAPSDIIVQEPINVNSEPNVRRSNRANKGKMPRALEDYEVEL